MRFFRSLTAAAALLLVAFSSWAASYQIASVLVDTEANIRAKTGLYTGQRAFASDFNGAEMRWSGAAWVWASHCQVIFRVRADVTAPTDTVDNALVTWTLPKLGTEDSLRVSAFFTMPNSATAKTISVKLGSAGSMASGFSLDMNALGATLNLVSEMRNQANAAAQEWFSNNKLIFGAMSSSSVSTTTKDTGTAGKLLAINVLKATGSDAIVMPWADVSLCGAGVP